jgi:ElaB/YqjD/DUF883 family membrane-anchored ribosome-binding protein
MSESPEVAAARIEVERARANMIATAHQLQDRLSPKTLTREAIDGVKHKSADLVEDAVDAIRARPYAAGSVVAAIALFLAREPLMDLAGKLVDSVSGKKPRRSPRKQKNTERQKDTEAVE